MEQKRNASKQSPPKAADRKGKQLSHLAVSPDNYKYLLLGLGLIVLGFLLMMGGGSNNPDVFTGDRLFSFTRITLSPVIVIAGFGVEIYAIMRHSDKSDKDSL